GKRTGSALTLPPRHAYRSGRQSRGNIQTVSQPLPLAGLRVFEIGTSVAAPYAGLILASLGADLVKVERPEGDDARHWGPPFWHGASSIFQVFNINKRSIVVDLKDP